MNQRSLVGMTMGARKRAAHAVAFAKIEPLNIRDVATWVETWATVRDDAGANHRIGQRLRPCPGCEKCTDSPRLQVLGWTRIIGGHAKLTRIYSRWYRRAEYLLMIYRPGPTWNPAASGGVTKAEAWQNMADCLREHDQLKVFCDGSGVLPAKGKVRPCRPK